MNTIQYLSKQVYEKIAAGEVIERPSAVVRELIDNAIDAKATEIKILITEGGKRQIQVSDNGIGMSYDDLKRCYHQYATSKITSFEDIYEIQSLGFRGEALNSIAIVSHLSIQSKTELMQTGYQIQLENQQINDKKKVLCRTGTMIRCNHLFYNMPVRRKTLKTETTEFKQIKDVFIPRSILFFDKTLMLNHNGRDIYHLLPSKDALERIAYFFGDQIKDGLVAIKHESPEFRIQGYVSGPNLVKMNKKHQFIFVNHRPIISTKILHAIQLAYEGIIPIGLYPIVILFIEIAPQWLDVNIHPTKREIKIILESELHHQIYELIQKTIRNNPRIPKLSIRETSEKSSHYSAINDQKFSTNNKKIPCYQKTTKQKFNQTCSHNKAGIQEKPLQTQKLLSLSGQLSTQDSYRIIGTIFKTYILIECYSQFILIDQHAAHERIKYEKIKQKIQSQTNIPTQNLLQPYSVDIIKNEFTHIEANLDAIHRLGFDVKAFGENTLLVNGIPYFVDIEISKQLLQELINQTRTEQSLPSILEFMDKSLKMHACRNAIKSGQILNEKQIHQLVQEWMSYPNASNCIHGRPTALYLNQSDMEQLFLRKR